MKTYKTTSRSQLVLIVTYFEGRVVTEEPD